MSDPWPAPSPAAIASMRALASEYSLGFLFNPGGGEFTHPLGRCQISAIDDEDDLRRLQAWIAERGAAVKAYNWAERLKR